MIFPRPITIRLIAFAYLSTAGGSVIAQSLADGLDAAAGVGELTTTSATLDGAALPTSLWRRDTVVAHDEVDSVKSALPPRSESRLATTIAGPALVSFWWKLVADPNGDRLYFISENDFSSIQGNQDWQPRTFQVDTGPQPVEWLFERFSINPATDREAWIDQLVVTPIPNSPSLQSAVDHSAHTIHSTDWSSQTYSGAVNGTAAHSGLVGPGETSSMVLEVEGPAAVTFDWAISSDEASNTRLTFLVDNNEVSFIAGNQDLSASSIDLPPGSHGLKFLFYRDTTQSEGYLGTQEAFVDNLSITTVPQVTDLADAVEQSGAAHSSSWTRLVDPQRTGADVAVVSAPQLNEARRLYLDIPDTAGLLSFWTRTDSDIDKGVLYVSVDGKIVAQRSGETQWLKTEVNLPAKSGRYLEATFYRNANLDAGSASTRVFLDEVVFTEGANNYQPDLLIGPKGKPLRGSGLYNSTGTGQVATVSATPRRPYGQYAIRCRNSSSSDPDTLGLRSIGASRDFEVLFVVNSGGRKLNFGAALKTGRFKTEALDPGGHESHEIWVVRKKGSIRRDHRLRILATSSADPAKSDAVGTALRIGR
jgi:hypothetical protein